MSNGQIVHPELEALRAFAVGDLSEIEAKDVEVHIAECETCCETLLNLENDTFIDLVVRSKDVQLESQRETEDVHHSSVATPDSVDEADLLTELANHPRYQAPPDRQVRLPGTCAEPCRQDPSAESPWCRSHLLDSSRTSRREKSW